MTRARNKVIAGAYEGKLVSHAGSKAYIIMKLTETLALDASTVKGIEVIDESSDISLASAATRGFIGEMLFGPMGLAAAGTAKRDERYILGIVFRDDKRSVIEVDGDLYRLIVASTEWLDLEPEI